MGVAPKSLDEGWRLAQWFAKSELVPKNFRNKPEDVLVAIQAGVELGLPPFQALASIAVINGRAGVWGDGFLALIVSSPLYRDHDEYYEVVVAGTPDPVTKEVRTEVERRDGVTLDDLKKDSTTAVCTFTRANKATPVTRRFSVGQARKAGLLGKEGPWQNYPDRMLAMRARGFAGRDAFPDLLRGIRPAEELRDIADDEREAPRVVVAEVRRMSEAQPAAAPAVAQPTEPPTAVVTLDPMTVKAVARFLGGFVVTLGNGQQADVFEAADAAELEKFVGTPQKVRLTVERIGDTMALRAFESAD